MIILDIKFELRKLVNEGKWFTALEYINALDLELSKDSEFLLLCGKVFLNNYRLCDAIDILKLAFAIDNANYDIALSLAEVCIKTERKNEALAAFKSLNEIDPNGFDSLRIEYMISDILEKSIADKINILEQMNAIEYDENNSYTLAKMYWADKRYDKCEKECRKLINYFRSGDFVEHTKELLLALNEKKNLTPPKPNEIKECIKEKENIYMEKVGESTEKLLPSEIEKEFEKFVGMKSVKRHILSFVNEAKLDHEREKAGILTNVKRGYHFMLVGNPGTGKTEIARVISKILFKIRIRKSENLIEVDKSGLVGKYIGHTEEKVKDIIEKAQGGTLFIDEAYTLFKKDNDKDFGIEALNILMKAMEDKRDSFTVILAGYKKQMFEMLEANEGLKSRINLIIEIPDYSDNELLQIADKMAENMGLIITDEGKKALRDKINRERIDEKFANARFIRDTLIESYRNLANRLANVNHTKEDMLILKAVDFGVNLEIIPEKEIEEALKELKSLTGLNEVKIHAENVINSMRIKQEMIKRGLRPSEHDLGSMHMIFRGSPGTGKTTVARIIGRIYKAMGLLKRGDVFIECSRADFVAGYLGQTAIKTKGMIKKALGGILFIDEAYSLKQDEHDTFGQEAIDILIADMENYRDKLMVILCGYRSEMDTLLKANYGMSSRISQFIDFQDYSLEELTEIFSFMIAKKGLFLGNGALDKAKLLIDKKSKDESFGNARGVRNIVESIIRNQNNRLAKSNMLSDKDYLIIEEDDIFV